jgi:hypothetical protein
MDITGMKHVELREYLLEKFMEVGMAGRKHI